MLIDYINKIDDRINPIVVKEIRQYLNGRSIIPLIVFTLLLELGAMTIFMLTQIDSIQGKGEEFFAAIMVVLALACSLGVAFPCSGRISQERKAESMDLIYTTVLSPYRIVSGKLFSAMTMVVLLISLCLPFMCVSYYLRGIDLPTILVSTYILFLLMIPTILGMILFGIMCSNIVVRVIMLIVGGNLFFSMFGGLGMLSMRHSGISISSIPELIMLLWITFFVLMVSAGFYVLAVASLSHVTANRALPIRIFLASVWLLTLVAMVGLWLYEGRGGDIKPWVILMSYLFAINAVFSICERDTQTFRVLRYIPAGRLKQLFYCLFSTGGGNNLFFSLVFLVATYSIYFMKGETTLRAFYHDSNIVAISAGVAMYLISYAALTMGVKKILNRFFKINAMAIVIVLMLTVIFIPMIACAMVYKERCVDNDLSAPFMVLSPAVFGYTGYQEVGLMVSFCMFIASLILVASDLFCQLKPFFPSAPEPKNNMIPVKDEIENADA